MRRVGMRVDTRPETVDGAASVMVAFAFASAVEGEGDEAEVGIEVLVEARLFAGERKAEGRVRDGEVGCCLGPR